MVKYLGTLKSPKVNKQIGTEGVAIYFGKLNLCAAHRGKF